MVKWRSMAFDDGLVHDLTTATSWADGILWVSRLTNDAEHGRDISMPQRTCGKFY